MPMKNSTPFPYYVGIHSLHDVATKHSRVCVMNILGNESSKVTPISHQYSAGNVVAGVQYGRSGTNLETDLGDIPVYGSVKEVIDNGRYFDTGVIYLPPAAVSSAVSELCAGNDDLQKIVIVTEKISVRDSRYIRWGCQARQVDVIGANSLGVANTWDKVRIGGALGGDKPEESLKQGSIAIYSNSGNFCTTLAEYLKTAGFGTSTIISSGKDIYIHYALPEFLYAAENDPRTKAIVVYIEPGGYYEKQALDWITEGRFQLTKPIVAVVTGRWKKNLRRSVGHAGAIGGSGDDAETKEKWFDSYFGLPVYNAKKPRVDGRGVRVATIQDVPLAVGDVMRHLGEEPDFAPEGDLSLKPWFVNDQGVAMPSKLSLSPTKALAPYDKEIEIVNSLVGAHYLRQPMRNKSGASRMIKKTNVAELHGISVLSLVQQPFASTSVFSVTKELPDPNQLKILSPVMNWFVHKGTRYSCVAAQARKAGASPNAYIGAALLSAGDNEMFRALRDYTAKLIDLFYTDIGTKLEIKTDMIKRKLDQKPKFAFCTIEPTDEAVAAYLLELLSRHGLETIFTRFAKLYIEETSGAAERANPAHLVVASIMLSICWKPLTSRQLCRMDAEDLCVYLALNGIIAASSCIDAEKSAFWKKISELSDLDLLKQDYTVSLFELLFQRSPSEQEFFSFTALLNLTVTNGPGTLSAKGAKESVSAKNHLSTAFVGFLSNTGFAHGGNGFEAVKFLIEEFAEFDPFTVENEGELAAALNAIAERTATNYIAYKKDAKSKGDLDYKKIPCTNHPVFKGKAVNVDPREDYVRGFFLKNNIVNPFLEYYHSLVVELHKVGATPNIFCVNIDAVLAAVSLELLWNTYRKGQIDLAKMQDIVFSVFLLGRMAGTNAEIADHRARGRDMDCRTPASEVGFVR